ncbi:MAG: hypothetical protein ACJ797_19630, partial [Ktedonobacteraceae bacterium]
NFVTLQTVGAIFSFNRAGWSVSVVAFCDRKEFLQVLRMWHFRRKCHMRKTCKNSFRSPKATTLTDHPARLNENIAPTV